MEEVSFELDRNMGRPYISEVSIYNGKGDRIKVMTLTNSVNQDQMQVSFSEENFTRKKAKKK